MKDYYRILGLPEDATPEDIKSAFRRLAFEYHPDTSRYSKSEAEERFKEINEAYGVLGDEARKQQYDAARKGQFVPSGYGDFRYSQQDIFQGIINNPAMYEEISRMFSQAGLRFDRAFFEQTLRGNGTVYQFFAGPGGVHRSVYSYGDSSNQTQTPYPEAPVYKPNWFERLLGRIVAGISRFALRSLFGIRMEPPPAPVLNEHMGLEISPSEAATGIEKQVTVKRGRKKRKLLVKIPAGIKSGTEIRLKGIVGDKNRGDLYLHVSVKDEPVG